LHAETQGRGVGNAFLGRAFLCVSASLREMILVVAGGRAGSSVFSVAKILWGGLGGWSEKDWGWGGRLGSGAVATIGELDLGVRAG